MKLDGSLYTRPNGVEIRLPTIYLLEKNKETGEWEKTEKTLYIDETLFNNLYSLTRNAMHYNGDALIVIDGEEGSGKSTLGRQIAIVMDNSFTHERICYSTKEYVQMCKDSGKWKALLLDESKEDLDRKSTMSKKNKWFMNFLSQSRQTHNFGIVVLPSIYDLDKYVAEHRAKFLIHCYKHKGKTPGFFRFYGKNSIKKLFATSAKFRNYNVYPAFSGRFTNGQVVDLDKYDKKKSAALDKYFGGKREIDPNLKKEIIKEFILDRLHDFPDELEINEKDKAKLYGYSYPTLLSWKSEDDRFDYTKAS